MTEAPAERGLVDAARRAAVLLAEEDSRVWVVSAEPGGPAEEERFRSRFPGRYRTIPPGDPSLLPTAARCAEAGDPVFAVAPAEEVVGPAYAVLRRTVAAPAANVKILAAHTGALATGAPTLPGVHEDIGLMRGVPGLIVAVPADAPTAANVVRCVGGLAGPAYVRLSRAVLPTVTDGSFRLARATTLRDGADLGIVAVGAMVAPALSVAEELSRVGVSARVLDLACVKPFDEPALLRAARDTGALLVAEEHSVTTGVGSLVAAVTAENYPVPVRRVGIPDVLDADASPRGPFPLSRERLADEAFELLRLRGKVE